MKKTELLQFIYDRMKNVHGENENYDYMHRLREIIESEKRTENTFVNYGVELDDREQEYDINDWIEYKNL
jgi:hypothetical protein